MTDDLSGQAVGISMAATGHQFFQEAATRHLQSDATHHEQMDEPKLDFFHGGCSSGSRAGGEAVPAWTWENLPCIQSCIFGQIFLAFIITQLTLF